MTTPGYMAPEQIADPRSVGPAVDVFALGAVLVFATTAASPYSGGDAAAVIYRIVHGEPTIDGVPDELRALVSACLAKNPADRPRPEAVAAAALRIVDHFANQDVIGTVPTEPVLPDPTTSTADTVLTSLPETGGRSVRPTADGIRPRRRFGRGQLGVLAALLVAALGVTSWFAVEALGRPAHASATGTTTRSATASVKKTATSAAAAFAGGTVLAGPGCPSSPWSVFSITSGSLETGVGGGDPACGGAADAFRKSGNPTESGASAEWDFDFKRPVVCSLRIYVANTDPSSGFAVYTVTSGGVTNHFQVSQADNKGQFVANASLNNLAPPHGVIKVTLTDISVLTGDQNHVTASSVSAACQAG